MGARRPSAAAAGALGCATLALWVSFGALSFVGADDARHVGLLPPIVWLAALLVAAALIAIVLRPPRRLVAPLWLSGVVLLPWLPFRLPLSVFIWNGPIVLWLWLAIAGALLIPALEPIWRTRQTPRRAALLAGVLAAVAYGLATWSIAPQHPDGDEPHYLIITQSLLKDHDLKIENNHRQGDYRAYVNRPLKPDFLQRGTDGEIYSIHAPGLPVMVAPAFALLGYPGVLIELVLVSAAAGALVWLAAWHVTGDSAASWFGWATFALSVPFFFHESAVFPDGPGAVITAIALLPLVDARAREPKPLLAVGAALAALPWLSSRFAVLAVTFGLVIAVRLVANPARRASRLAAFAACPVISAIAFFLFFQVIYGTPNPSVVYANSPTMTMTAGNLVRGLPGLLFDQQFGIIPNAPVFLCAFAGIALLMWRGPRRLGLELLAIAVPYLLVATSFYSWWGGTTPPARYAVPMTPLLAVAAAFWFSSATSSAVRIASLCSLVVSLLMTATMASVSRGLFVFNFRDGISRVAIWLSPVVDLTTALPSLFQNPPGVVWMQTGIWLAAIALAVMVAAIFNRRGRSAVMLAFGLALEAATMGAATMVWRTNHATAATPYAAGAVLLRRYDPQAHQIAVTYRPFRRIDPAELTHVIVLARTLSTGPGAASTSMAHLPAGVYEISGTTIGSSGGHLRLRTDLGSGPIADWDAASFHGPWTRQVTLPVAVAALQIDVDDAARTTLRDVSVRAVSLLASQANLDNREATMGARYGPAMIFLVDGHAWVEPGGIWVVGGSNAQFVVAPDVHSSAHLLVRNGPVDNLVTIESPDWRERLSLKPGEEQLLRVPIAEHSTAVLLRVAAANGFRPVDVDPTSADERYLGVWIETR